MPLLELILKFYNVALFKCLALGPCLAGMPMFSVLRTIYAHITINIIWQKFLTLYKQCYMLNLASWS